MLREGVPAGEEGSDTGGPKGHNEVLEGRCGVTQRYICVLVPNQVRDYFLGWVPASYSRNTPLIAPVLAEKLVWFVV